MSRRDQMLRDELDEKIRLRTYYQNNLRNPTFKCPRYRYEDQKRISELTTDIDVLSARLGDRD